jgi:D-xylose 1-dehydrogenase (NADP+, D-xylono-1,5-lactone-forming)
MDRKVGWGILGCAGIAEKAFIPAVNASRNGFLAAIASRDEAKARAWGVRYDIHAVLRTYQDIVEDPTVDAIYIPLPNNLHAEWAIRALKAGKHVLCEKPLGMTAAEVEAMIAAAEANRVLLLEGFMYKFHPQIAKTLEIVGQGRLGEVRAVHSAFTFQFERDGANYRWTPAMGGGALYDVGCYTVSIVRLVFGAEPVSAFAAARFDPATGIDMTTAAVLEFPGGRFAHCESSFEEHFQSRLLAVGTEGTLQLDRAFSAKGFDVALAIVRGDLREAVRIRKADMFRLMAEHFADAVLGREPLRVPAADALGNARALDACFESIRTGRTIALPAAGR